MKRKILLILALIAILIVVIISCSLSSNETEEPSSSSEAEKPSSSSEAEKPSSSSESKKPSSSSESKKPSSSSESEKPSSSSKAEKPSSSSEAEKSSSTESEYPKKIGLEIEGEMAAVEESFYDSSLDKTIMINDIEFKNKVYGYLEGMISQEFDDQKNPVSGGFSFRIHLYRNGAEEIYGISPTPNGQGYHYINNFQSTDDSIEYLLDEDIFTILLELFNVN